MAQREFVDSVRTTLEGKLALAVMLGSPFLMKSMLVTASLRAADANGDMGLVLLTCAHLALAVSLVLGVIGQTARDLIVERKDDPLAFHPDGRLGLAAYHLCNVVTVASLVILSFFYLFFGALIPGLTHRPLLAIPMHVTAHALVLCTLGVVAYRSSLRLHEWRPALGRSLDIGAGGGSILAFLVMAASGTFFMDLEPATLSRLGGWSERAAVFYPPLAALIPETEGLLGPSAWATGVLLATLIALATVRRPLREPSRLLFGEIGTPLGRSFSSIFRAASRPQRHGLPHLRIFFLKDIVLPARRHLQRSFVRNWVLLGIAVTVPVALWQLRREGWMTETAAEAVLWGVVMLLPAITAYVHGLGSLGREGDMLTLLRTTLRPAQILGYKLLPVLLVVVWSGLVFGAIAGGVSAGLALEPGPLEASAIGGLTAIVAALNAVALGFLFPDFRRRSVLAKGSSWAGRRSFEGLAVNGIGIGVAARAMAGTPLLPTHSLPGILVLTAGLGLVLAGILAFFALRRFPELET